MRRRDFGKVSLSLVASRMLTDSTKGAGGGSSSDFPKTPGLTEYVGQFVLGTKYQDIPQEVIELGKKSILDGLGLALAGSRAESGPISRKYVENLGIRDGKATIIGSAQKTSPRFAAFINALSIPPNNYDYPHLPPANTPVSLFL